MTPLLKLAGVVLLLVLSFKGTVALFPRSWTHDYEGLTAFGGWVGLIGAVFITGAVLNGLNSMYGDSEPPENL